jgi:hypothetical protein
MHLRDASKERGNPPPIKVSEDGMMVNQYPESFRKDAEDLIDWYVKRFIHDRAKEKVQPALTEEVKRKRKRIVSPLYKTSNSRNQCRF